MYETVFRYTNQLRNANDESRNELKALQLALRAELETMDEHSESLRAHMASFFDAIFCGHVPMMTMVQETADATIASDVPFAHRYIQDRGLCKRSKHKR